MLKFFTHKELMTGQLILALNRMTLYKPPSNGNDTEIICYVNCVNHRAHSLFAASVAMYQTLHNVNVLFEEQSKVFEDAGLDALSNHVAVSAASVKNVLLLAQIGQKEFAALHKKTVD